MCHVKVEEEPEYEEEEEEDIEVEKEEAIPSENESFVDAEIEELKFNTESSHELQPEVCNSRQAPNCISPNIDTVEWAYYLFFL